MHHWLSVSAALIILAKDKWRKKMLRMLFQRNNLKSNYQSLNNYYAK